MKKYLCNLIVPGFPKCGTSSLHEYLDQHPSINMSFSKESHYFSRDEIWEKGVDYHNSLFTKISKKEKYYGDSSTTYCLSEPAIERIRAHLVTPKVVFVLQVFGEDDILMIRQEELKEKPIEVSNKVFKFLCISEKRDIKLVEVNQTKDVVSAERRKWVKILSSVCPEVFKKMAFSSSFFQKVSRDLMRKKVVPKPIISREDREWLTEQLSASISFYRRA